MKSTATRRLFLQRTAVVGIAASLAPKLVLASWPENAFSSKDVDGALSALYGSDVSENDPGIEVKAPDIAENGAVVPVTVTTSRPAESISIIAAENPAPLVASFELGEGAASTVSTRIKMGKTGDVVAVVKSGGKLYSNRKQVKVTIGGCGG